MTPNFDRGTETASGLPTRMVAQSTEGSTTYSRPLMKQVE